MTSYVIIIADESELIDIRALAKVQPISQYAGPKPVQSVTFCNANAKIIVRLIDYTTTVKKIVDAQTI